MDNTNLKAQKALINELSAEWKKVNTSKQITNFAVLKAKASKHDSSVLERKLDELKAKETKLAAELKREKKKLDTLTKQISAEKKAVLKQGLDKAANIGKTAAIYAYKGVEVAGVIYGLGAQADSMKLSDRSQNQSITAEKLSQKISDKKGEEEGYLNSVLEHTEEQKKQKHDDDKNNIQKLLKERDVDIKKGMAVGGKKLGEAKLDADKKLLGKLDANSPVLKNNKADKADVQNNIKGELLKKAGEDGKKLYDDKLKEEARREEAARREYYQKLNQDHHKKR